MALYDSDWLNDKHDDDFIRGFYEIRYEDYKEKPSKRFRQIEGILNQLHLYEDESEQYIRGVFHAALSNIARQGNSIMPNDHRIIHLLDLIKKGENKGIKGLIQDLIDCKCEICDILRFPEQRIKHIITTLNKRPGNWKLHEIFLLIGGEKITIDTIRHLLETKTEIDNKNRASACNCKLHRGNEVLVFFDELFIKNGVSIEESFWIRAYRKDDVLVKLKEKLIYNYALDETEIKSITWRICEMFPAELCDIQEDLWHKLRDYEFQEPIKKNFISFLENLKKEAMDLGNKLKTRKRKDLFNIQGTIDALEKAIDDLQNELKDASEIHDDLVGNDWNFYPFWIED